MLQLKTELSLCTFCGCMTQTVCKKELSATSMIKELKKEEVMDVNKKGVDFVVCSRTSYFSDDIKSNCEICGSVIFYRPLTVNISAKRVCLTYINDESLHPKKKEKESAGGSGKKVKE